MDLAPCAEVWPCENFYSTLYRCLGSHKTSVLGSNEILTDEQLLGFINLESAWNWLQDSTVRKKIPCQKMPHPPFCFFFLGIRRRTKIFRCPKLGAKRQDDWQRLVPAAGLLLLVFLTWVCSAHRCLEVPFAWDFVRDFWWKRWSPVVHLGSIRWDDSKKIATHPYLEDHPRTCKWLVTPIYKPFRPFGRGTILLRGLY